MNQLNFANSKSHVESLMQSPRSTAFPSAQWWPVTSPSQSSAAQHSMLESVVAPYFPIPVLQTSKPLLLHSSEQE